jgi:hypothetical protein
LCLKKVGSSLTQIYKIIIKKRKRRISIHPKLNTYYNTDILHNTNTHTIIMLLNTFFPFFFYFKRGKFVIAHCVTIRSSIYLSPHWSLFCFSLTLPSLSSPDLPPHLTAVVFPPLLYNHFLRSSLESLTIAFQTRCSIVSLNFATLLIPEDIVKVWTL